MDRATEIKIRKAAEGIGEHSCKNTCSGWKSGFEQGQQEMYDHLKNKLDLADRMACFIKNRRHFLNGRNKEDANELIDMYFSNDK